MHAIFMKNYYRNHEFHYVPGNNPEIVKMLLANGVSLKEGSVESHLHTAVRSNSLKCLQLFIDECPNSNVNLIGKSGMSAIHLAADLGHSRCLEILLDAPSADPNLRVSRGKLSTALHLAAEEGSPECVKLLLAKKADANLRDYRGFTPLHKACRGANLECVELLIGVGGAEVNAEDNDQRTPLHTAISKSDASLDVIEALIARRADINATDRYGFTALHLAAMDGLHG
jgi:ankyrin repeat protein